MNNDFVYTTYIRTTPEQLWKGLTSPEFTREYWGLEFHTDWEVGSEMLWDRLGVKTEDPEQVVLEFDPYSRLAYTWHTLTPEWAAAVGMDPTVAATVAKEQRSQVAFEIEDQGTRVMLKVVHTNFPPDSTMRTMIEFGWPQVLASLKTMLETGVALP